MSAERFDIDQALVAIGGNGSRLKNGGIYVPLSKSFIEVEGQPLFYWCVNELLKAGINRLVLVADTQEKLHRAESVVEKVTAGQDLKEVVLFQDEGRGTGRLPYYARHLLDNEFIFEFGHNITENAHYDEIRRRKTPEVIVYSGFKPDLYSDHAIVNVDRQTGIAQEKTNDATISLAVAAPFVLDQKYAEAIPSYHFNFLETVNSQVKKHAVVVVVSGSPIEIDVPKDYEETIPRYQDFVQQLYSRR